MVPCATCGFSAHQDQARREARRYKRAKLRCYGSNARFVSLLGAAPVAMPMGDVYDALSKGVVEA